MSSWIFVMTGDDDEFLERTKMKKWPIHKRTNHRKKLRKGDKVLIYLAGPHRQKIVANAVLGSDVTENGEEFSIVLSKINLWKNQILLKPLVNSLEFIKNKSKWGVSMQGGVVKITDNDFKTLSVKSGSNLLL